MTAAPGAGTSDPTLTRMFVNGQAMRGGSLHGPLTASGTFLGAARTATGYGFWSCRDEFPALQPLSASGSTVPGELYAVSFAVLQTQLLPLEPPELELTVISLDDGSGSLSMRLRDGIVPEPPDWARIPAGVGWLAYLASRRREFADRAL